MHYFYVLFALTFSAVVIFGEKPRRHAIQQVQNFESTFYSEHSGFPFLKIFYKEASSSRPKLGFLKFGISFLKVEKLKIKLDLRHASPDQLLNMWDELMTQRAIRYATLEPITLTLINQKESILIFMLRRENLHQVENCDFGERFFTLRVQTKKHLKE